MDGRRFIGQFNPEAKARPGASGLSLFAAIVFVAVAVYREPVPIGQAREMIQAIYQAGAVVLFGCFLWQYIGWPVVTLFVLAAWSTFHPVPTIFSISAFKLFVHGISWYALLFLVFRSTPRRLTWTICACGLIHAVYEICGRHLMTNENEISAFLAMTVPSFLALPKKLVWLILFPIAAIILTRSFNGLLAISVVLVVYGIYSYPALWIAYLYFAGCALALVWYYHDGPGWKVRLGWWIPAINLWTDNPFGIGLGNWKRAAKIMIDAGRLSDGCYRLHSTWLQGVIEMGVLFYCWVAVTLSYIVSKMTKHVHIANVLGVVVFVIIAGTNSIFRINAVCGLICIAVLVRFHLELCCERNT